MASTAADLKAELDKLGVEYPAKAKKADLEKLLTKARQAPTGSSSEGGASEEPAGAGEGPTDLESDPAPEAPAHDGPVLLKGLMHRGIAYAAGDPIPADLDEDDLCRLRRLGVVA